MLNNPHDLLDKRASIDILQECYHATIDIPEGHEDTVIAYLNFFGFEVVHEEGSVYTVRFGRWDE